VLKQAVVRYLSTAFLLMDTDYIMNLFVCEFIADDFLATVGVLISASSSAVAGYWVDAQADNKTYLRPT
jgi:hypothetical protein